MMQEQLWVTTSLRGVVVGELTASGIREGVHSGSPSQPPSQPFAAATRRIFDVPPGRKDDSVRCSIMVR